MKYNVVWWWSIMWFDKHQLCYNILYVCWLHVQNGWLHTFSKAYSSQSFSFPMLKATLPRSIVVWTSLTSSCPDSSSEYPECNPLKPLGFEKSGGRERVGETTADPWPGKELGPRAFLPVTMLCLFNKSYWRRSHRHPCLLNNLLRKA